MISPRLQHTEHMNEEKHTPGPWRVESGYPGTRIVHGDAFGNLICTTSGTRLHTAATVAANARLIAAAPELLEAAKNASTDPGGDYYMGLRFGVEDRDIVDRYEAAEYGWQQAMQYVESVLQHAIDKATKP